MPQYSIDVLCADRDESCEYVRSVLMKGYRIKFGGELDDFDHSGIKNFEDMNVAEKVALEMKKNSGGMIRGISLSLV